MRLRVWIWRTRERDEDLQIVYLLSWQEWPEASQGTPAGGSGTARREDLSGSLEISGSRRGRVATAGGVLQNWGVRLAD